MTVEKDIVLWDNGKEKLSLFPVPVSQQYRYIENSPCVTFGIAYENENYKGSVLACCTTKDDLRLRSPISYADSLAKANLKIFHGKFDNVVPYMQSVRLYLEIINVAPASRVFLDVFDGGHSMNMETAMRWLTSQMSKTADESVTG